MSNFQVHFNWQSCVGAGLAAGVALIAFRYSKRTVEQQERIANNLGRLVLAVEGLSQKLSAFQESVKKLEESLERQNDLSTKSRFLKRARSATSLAATDIDDDDMFESAEENEYDDEEKKSSGDDDLQSFFDRIDRLHKDTDRPEESQEEVFTCLQVKNKEMPGNTHILWRLARSHINRSNAAKAEGKLDRQKELIYAALSHARCAVELDETCWQAHQWFAITLGSTNQYESTDQKIKDGYTYKEHVARAIELNPNEPLLFHLLGRWCFAVSELNWLQRKTATMLFGSPPSSSYDEALKHFHTAEQLRPGFWKTNQLMIAKTYKQLSQTTECRKWLESALTITVVTPEDRESQSEIEQLLAEV